MGSVHDQLHQVEAGPSGEQMTRERALELATGLLGYPPFEQGWRFSKLAANVISEMILAAVAEAVVEEREACARIAESSPSAHWHIIAMQIRDRSKPLLSKSRQLLSQNQNSPE